MLHNKKERFIHVELRKRRNLQRKFAYFLSVKTGQSKRDFICKDGNKAAVKMIE